MLNILHNWCNKWRMKLNINKSEIVHFRNVNDKKSNCVFKYDECELEIVDKYKYLGIVLNEHLEYSMVAMILANSAGRVLLLLLLLLIIINTLFRKMVQTMSPTGDFQWAIYKKRWINTLYTYVHWLKH